MSKKVFISHASVDVNLVNIIIELLNNIGIEKNDIFCTSISGTLESGIDFIDQIKTSVQDSKIVLFLFTEHFYLSQFCLAELGAAWALNQNILPIIVPPISTTEYNKTPLLGIQAINIGNDNFIPVFINDLKRKKVFENNQNQFNIDKIITNFDPLIKNELGILRKDSNGFYLARLVEEKIISETKNYQMQCRSWGDYMQASGFTGKCLLET